MLNLWKILWIEDLYTKRCIQKFEKLTKKTRNHHQKRNALQSQSTGPGYKKILLFPNFVNFSPAGDAKLRFLQVNLIFSCHFYRIIKQAGNPLSLSNSFIISHFCWLRAAASNVDFIPLYVVLLTRTVTGVRVFPWIVAGMIWNSTVPTGIVSLVDLSRQSRNRSSITIPSGTLPAVCRIIAVFSHLMK